jgi:Ankyrin repeats (3 copies)
MSTFEDEIDRVQQLRSDVGHLDPEAVALIRSGDVGSLKIRLRTLDRATIQRPWEVDGKLSYLGVAVANGDKALACFVLLSTEFAATVPNREVGYNGFGHLLHIACFMRAKNTVKYLVTLPGCCPIDTNIQSYSSASPLAIAAGLGDLELCQIVLDLGASVNLPTCGDGNNALPHAIASKSDDIVVVLLRRGATISQDVFARALKAQRLPFFMVIAERDGAAALSALLSKNCGAGSGIMTAAYHGLTEVRCPG